MAGYSKRPLVDKLGIKANFKVHLVHPPKNYDDTLGELPVGVNIVGKLEGPLDFIIEKPLPLVVDRKKVLPV